MEEISVKIDSISKVYKLYDKPMDRLKESINPFKNKYHKDFYALKNISFEVKKGETVGIIGKNGSGKSTLLKIITGVLTPTSGSIEVNGKVSALLELGAGFNPEYTGVENIYLNGTIMGFTKEDMDKKLDDILKFADIGDFIYQPVKTYSSGMFARLAFAVAINVEPDILIVDEALSVGDIAFQNKCYRRFSEFKKIGKTILFVSHAMDSILKYCDKVFVINNGILECSGNAKDMIDVYKKILVNCYDDDEYTNENKDIVNQKKVHKQTAWKLSFSNNPNVIEYGTKDAEIVDYGLFDIYDKPAVAIRSNDIVNFKMRVKFNRKIHNPIFAFTIKDIKGNEIAGTNSLFEEVETGTYNEGDLVTISFKQKLKMPSSNYLLSLGCTNFINDELVVYHRLYDVLIFEVISLKNMVGYFDIESTIQVERE